MSDDSTNGVLVASEVEPEELPSPSVAPGDPAQTERVQLAKPIALALYEAVRLVCRQCGKHKIATLPKAQIVGPVPFICKSCSEGRSMLDGMTEAQIEANPLARSLARKRRGHDRQKERDKDRESRFHKRNGFTHAERDKRVDACRWKCSFCGRELTKEARKPNSVVMYYTDEARSLENAIPACRACQCKKVGRLAARLSH